MLFNSIPEFPTVTLPIAAVLGLVFIFQQRKNKKE
ncbi:MAG: PEF-CTERM sorting domain-containing protein [Methanosarcinales archaeon]|nr:MAG: PEF-CTERM sorting domain-containing protein [Methanosarcinales archaeon]